MSRYLEFATPDRRQLWELSRGNPLHNGKLPTRFREMKGVRVDGKPMDFNDGTLAERLHRALVDGKAIRPKLSFRCVAFAALMHGLELSNPLPASAQDSIYRISRATKPIKPKDRPILPLDLGRERPDLDLPPAYDHMIYPAHTTEAPQYVHKLGNGPICLSGLEAALKIMGDTFAHEIKVFELR